MGDRLLPQLRHSHDIYMRSKSKKGSSAIEVVTFGQETRKLEDQSRQ